MDVVVGASAVEAVVEEEEEEENVDDLVELLDEAEEEEVESVALNILKEEKRNGPKALQVKERALYALTRAYCKNGKQDCIVSQVLTSQDHDYFVHITKAKIAKVVRAILDIVSLECKDDLNVQVDICTSVIAWCRTEKRTFLRQRVEAKLASVLYEQHNYSASLKLIDGLLVELKKLDDKQLLVEIHLIESKLHHALRALPKAKAALTASRTCANAIYVAPALQATIDTMSGILHCEERDYNTAHSYFLEAFEQLDTTLDDRERAMPCLKYMMLCRILDSLVHTKKNKTTLNNKSDGLMMISAKQSIKYAGRHLDAMSAIAKAASRRSLKDFEALLQEYKLELVDDVLIQHHLLYLKEQLLERNLIRIMEPYSCVELSHIASVMEFPLPVVEKKLSQMILDGKLNGILDQGKGQLIVYEDADKDMAMDKGLQVIANMDTVITSLFARSQALRTMMA